MTSDEPVVSRFVTVAKDLITLLRDSSLFALAVLLLIFPTTFNSMLVQAGFEEGSFVGFKWKSKLVESNQALEDAHGTITNLQKKNDDLVKALAEANGKLDDPRFKERIAELDKENSNLKLAAQQVQSSVARTIDSNAPFVQKALQDDRGKAASTLQHRQKSDYLVGLQTFGVPDNIREDLNAKIRAKGYGLHEVSASYQMGERPSWLAQRSTVFYYTAAAQAQAQELARELNGLTGQEFAVRQGSGLGVDPSQRDVTLFVHYVKG